MSTKNYQPLAESLRPQGLAEFVGQSHLLAPGRALRECVEAGRLHSMILWGPPGSGKTTLARLVAGATTEFRAGAVSHFRAGGAVRRGTGTDRTRSRLGGTAAASDDDCGDSERENSTEHGQISNMDVPHQRR